MVLVSPFSCSVDLNSREQLNPLLGTSLCLPILSAAKLLLHIGHSTRTLLRGGGFVSTCECLRSCRRPPPAPGSLISSVLLLLPPDPIIKHSAVSLTVWFVACVTFQTHNSPIHDDHQTRDSYSTNNYRFCVSQRKQLN